MMATSGRSASIRPPSRGFDLVGDVRNHLDGGAEVLAAPLLRDHGLVDLPGREVVLPRHPRAREALVVAEVEVGLGPVVRDEDLAVLVRAHRAGVDVDVRVELHHRDAEPARLEQRSDRGARQPLPDRRDDPPGDEQVLRGFSAHRQEASKSGGIAGSTAGPRLKLVRRDAPKNRDIPAGQRRVPRARRRRPPEDRPVERPQVARQSGKRP